MRVAIDVTAMIAGSTGVARYATELCAALRAEGVDLMPYAIGRAVVAPPPGVHRIPVPYRLLQRAWSANDHPRIERLTPPADVVHTLDLVAPPTRRPAVATVHDLDALEQPSLHSPRRVATQRAQVASLRRVAVVLSDSEATRAALCRYGIGEDRIVVSSLGLTRLDPDPGYLLETGGRPFVLTVGTIDVRKGQDVLIRAIARLPDVVAVLAGPDQWQADTVRTAARRAGVAERVRFLGRVSDGVLGALYRAAAVVCVPSRAEGFGLPLLEAMAAGTPVVASDLPATREVGGAAAVLVPAGDDGALAEAIGAVLGDPTRRAAMADAGLTQAARFRWDDVARATRAAYERALG